MVLERLNFPVEMEEQEEIAIPDEAARVVHQRVPERTVHQELPLFSVRMPLPHQRGVELAEMGAVTALMEVQVEHPVPGEVVQEMVIKLGEMG
jgi:hypothetical protein